MKENDDLSLKKVEKYESKRSDITWETGRAGTLTLWYITLQYINKKP